MVSTTAEQQVGEIHDALLSLDTCEYGVFDFGRVRVLLRKSTFHRRGSGPQDYDIVQIEVEACSRRQGIGTRFVLDMIQAAKGLGRGVYFEEAFMEGSYMLCMKMERLGLFRRKGGSDTFLSVY